MHIIAIGWLWVALMMSITQPTIVSGVSTFIFYGLLPCALLIYLLTTPARRRAQSRRAAAAAEQPAGQAENQASTADTPGV